MNLNKILISGIIKTLIGGIILLLLGLDIWWGYTQISSQVLKLVYILIVLNILGILFLIFPKIKAFFLLTLISTISAFFFLIYPTILFVYIKFLIMNGGLYLLALWPCLILLFKKRKTSPRTIVGICFECFLIALVIIFGMLFSPILNRYTILYRYIGNLIILSGLSLFYLFALLAISIFKKKEISWWLILLPGNIIYFLALLFYCYSLFNILPDIALVRSETECLKLNDFLPSDGCRPLYEWEYGVCIKGKTCLCVLGHDFE